MELSSLLKELSCPYSVLISGPIAHRFQSKEDRLLLLNYLMSELMAAKMSHKLTPHKKVVIEIVRKNKNYIQVKILKLIFHDYLKISWKAHRQSP